MDGMDAVRGQGPAQTADLARVQSSASSVSPQQQIFTDVTLPVRDRLSTVPQQLPEQHHVAEHVHQRVIVEGMTFSPPEEQQRMKQWVRQAPLLYGQANNGSGSSPESLTQEQVVAEVQKRVRQEMQQHFERQSALEAENVQLKGILEAMLANQAPGPGVQGADVTERVSRPQGGATSSAEARQDGILEAPVRSQERPPGNPPGLSQGDGAQWGCGPEVLRASGAPPLHDSAR